jgi:hypothetical protein
MGTCRDCPVELPPYDGHVASKPVLCEECRARVRRESKKRNRARRQKKPSFPKLQGTRKSRAIQRAIDFIESCKRAPCLDCGLSFPSICMDFDHRSTEVKSRNVSACKTIESARFEMTKCDLVCACCHRIRTAKRLAGEVI